VKKFSGKKIQDFISSNYNPEEIVFCSVGNISDEKILRYFQKHFSVNFNYNKKNIRENKVIYKPASVTKKKDTYQNHCIIGNIAYDLKDNKRIGMFLLNNILGGPGLNSRLNMSLREKNGLAYNVESNYNPYTDTGIFSVYFGTDSKLLDKSLQITMSEFKKLRTEKLGTIQLIKAKNQMKGYLARGYENYESLMLSLGRNILVFNKIDSFDYLCKQIDDLSSSELLDIANDVFNQENFSTLIYK
jgi:predicted Zn-dependent peptidase